MNSTAIAATMHPPVTRPGLQVEVVSDYDSLLKLKPTWDELVEQSGIDHPFLNHEWICTWWERFGAGKRLYILLIKAGARVVGIAPLMRREARMYGSRVRCLESLYNPHTPRFDFIVARDAEGAYRGLWRHLLSVAGEWEVLELAQLPTESRAPALLSQLARESGYWVGTWHGEDSPYLPLRGGWENYVKRLSRHHRANVRNRLNRLVRLGEVRLEVVSAGDRLAGALDDGLRIEAAAWKAGTGTAIRSRPDVDRFYRDFAERAAGTGVLRLLFLTVAGARIAFAYALCYRNKLYVLKTGYDPAYARYSPYNLLCYLVFHDGFERGLDEYEFLGGSEAWKLVWTRESKPHDWLFVFAPGWRTRLIYSAKFQWMPRLRRQPLYLRLHNAIFLRDRRASRGFWRKHRPVEREVGGRDEKHSPHAQG